jgi:hypothetical protein
MDSFTISPITKINTIVYSKCRIYIDELILNTKATIRVVVHNNEDTESKTFVYEMTQQEYQRWLTDDYLIEYIKNKLRDEVF